MSSKLKLYLGRKVIESFNVAKWTSIAPAQLKPLIQIGVPPSENNIEMNISLNALENRFGIPSFSFSELVKLQPDEIVQNICLKRDRANREISFEINRNIFIKDVIENCAVPDCNLEPKKIVVDYSSPNIAKPFHVGHVRSTIIGNFIANLHNYLNNNVVRLNYLGDWGTQFGFIQVGVDKLKLSHEDIKRDPMKLLYESYVYANQLAESDAKVSELARNHFTNLEKGETDNVSSWKTYIGYTVDELQTMYDRLGVKFDEYNYESMYRAKDIQNIIDTLKQKNILQVQHDGKQTATINDRKVSLIKSDGSTLYLTRDIAAAIDRFKKYTFDQMYYVAENGQNDHFNALTGILYKMDLPWASRLKHIKFGRIRGMSTRKGKVVFLKDLLDETRELMIQKQVESPRSVPKYVHIILDTKVPMTDIETSDILGVSCVIVNDLKQRRQKDYEFSWDRVLQIQGDSGIKLQYTHCRLCNLERNCGAVPAQECRPELLDHPEITSLVRELARFHDVLCNAQKQLEACILVTYLFHLCNYINRALKLLQVKDQEAEIAAQRLLVFNTARDVLGQGMKILGLKPLTKM